ncbi:hypothetical protein CDAR_31161 [Caerostris darwini]|uniref:Uncharacterized protein n=1 Tax=Caerostris darwini TaxID=1538125 RepID=A0AAV4RZH0_9ARAC|nr:hypothetical protein CDAR_31161 [Caerostris darwini]
MFNSDKNQITNSSPLTSDNICKQFHVVKFTASLCLPRLPRIIDKLLSLPRLEIPNCILGTTENDVLRRICHSESTKLIFQALFRVSPEHARISGLHHRRKNPARQRKR